jgi:hypothetical protein
LRCANNANHVEKQSDIFRQERSQKAVYIERCLWLLTILTAGGQKTVPLGQLVRLQKENKNVIYYLKLCNTLYGMFSLLSHPNLKALYEYGRNELNHRRHRRLRITTTHY